MSKYRYIVWIICVLWTINVKAQVWRSHLAYNNVTQIAMSQDKVFGLSSGSLFSVDKTTELISVYDSQSGLHGSDITGIYYDEQGKQLIIGYWTGKIDILTTHGMLYISALYEKDMTQRKTINNITVSGRTAYLATPYGVQTMDLVEHKLVDSYWLHPDGQEIEIEDVMIANDSIYAFTSDSMFCASMRTNLSDYTYWKREKRSSRIRPDADKGKHYHDGNDDWYAGGTEGIVRQTPTERLSYKPQGPLDNNPYRMTAHNRLWIVPGGRWASQNWTPGTVMIYDGKKWTNITSETIKKKTGQKPYDFMNVAVDPLDENHYFITSYGTGLYEFRSDTVVRHWIAGSDNTMVPAAANPANYTRLDAACFDKENNLWFLDAADEGQLQCLDNQGEWHAVTLQTDGGPMSLATPCGLCIDNRNSNYKWIGVARAGTCLYLLDDAGTAWDASDDRYKMRSLLVNQHGREFNLSNTYMRALIQDSQGRVWMGTENGAAYIPAETDFFNSDAVIQPEVYDDNGDNPITESAVYAICEDKEGNIWIGTNKLGVYVLNSSATSIIAHYTTDNSAMAANGVLSLACDDAGSVFVGTGNGLAQYLPHVTPESTDRTVDAEGRRLGSVMQWKLHFSYQNPQEIIGTPSRIYALANGALFYVDRADDQMHYLSKASGLNGSTISHIAYDSRSEKLVIAYEDGRIDLLAEDGYVQQMPDLHMKASSVAIAFNAVVAGSRHTYMAMPFGILAINTTKAEISDTYYIGDEAASVEVLQIVEQGDSLYAFTNGYLYAAALNDNLVDYHFWHKTALPGGTLTRAATFAGELHTLIDNILYRRHNGKWTKAMSTKLQWIHESNGYLLTYVSGKGLYRITENYQLTGLTDRYQANDAVYTQGEYWMAETEMGLIRLSTSGDVYFHPNGPNSNFGYFLHSAHGRVYATVGGRWASQFNRLGKVNIYDGQNWTGLAPYQIRSTADNIWVYDPVSIAVDNSDPEHFYIATYTAGVFEYTHGSITHYTDGVNGSTLRVAVDGYDINVYTRTDGAVMDSLGNMWVLNATDEGAPVHVVTPDHKWHKLSYRDGSHKLILTTPKGIWPDRRTGNRKWFIDQRSSQGLILLDDGGTPVVNSDDRLLKRSEFYDQQGKQVAPSYLYCVAQDHSNRLWVGTESGIFIIPAETDFFTSNTCYRIIIPRNDGTGLGDYLLGDEQINCMAVDGGNRMWIGTETSGLYLIEDDTITVAHFTANNSMLPSDAIQSIAIVPTTGEVFVGTDKGIASYLSDASEPHEDMSQAYAFPNPVRPDYGGAISITGLMDNSEVNIVDAGGNLVCKTRSHGGTAVWDGRLPDGRRATSGVYTALCNTSGGHTAVKILFIQ